MLFHRLVIDVDIDPQGRLRPRPGATWRSEPARGEAAIHRRLARLADVPDARIATVASTHGFLRRHDSAVMGLPGPESSAATMASGQEAVDDSARVRDWLDRGLVGPPPEGTADTIATIALYASLPDGFLDACEAFIDGSVALPATSADAFFTAALPAVAVAGPAVSPIVANPGLLRTFDRTRLRRALRINEWITRFMGGLEPEPQPLAAVGGSDALMRQLTVAFPEAFAIPALLDGPDGRATAFVRALATETLDDWRTAARDMGARVRALDLSRKALGTDGISPTEKEELADIHVALADYRSPTALPAAEIAERLRPLLARSIESELIALGAWPLQRGALTGLYVRALVGARTDLLEAPPPVLCATPDCGAIIPATRNRRYCDRCQMDHRRNSVRATRSRSAASHGGAR